MRLKIILMLIVLSGLPSVVRGAEVEVQGSEHWKSLEEAERIDVDGLYRLRERLGDKLVLYDARSPGAIMMGTSTARVCP